MKYATADISWPGGSANIGDEVDESAIPAITRARWEDEGILSDEAPAAATENKE